MTTHSLPLLHMAALTDNLDIENDCPCGKAPCGLVDDTLAADSCRVHGPNAAVGLLQHHRPGECPALFASRRRAA